MTPEGQTFDCTAPFLILALGLGWLGWNLRDPFRVLTGLLPARTRRFLLRMSDRALILIPLTVVCFVLPAAAKVAKENAPKYEEILRLFGEGLLIKDIVERVGVSPPMVRATLKRHGLTNSRQKRRWRSLGPAQREAHLRRLQTASREAREQEASALVTRFAELGATYAAVHALAEQQGVTAKSMADRLRKAGADVPDGRLAAKSRFTEDDRRRMCEMYAEGFSQSQVAARFRTNQAYVSQLLREQGAATRPFARSSRSDVTR